MQIGHITIVNRSSERRVEAIERSGTHMQDSEQRRRSMRQAEVTFQRQISRGSKLRLYNRNGVLLEEAE